ncbi:MAG: hypothetical protein J0L76_22355 [Rhodobacterales bacterium]|nr:hypothetical protein [Rhodobacterales bacterium]
MTLRSLAVGLATTTVISLATPAAAYTVDCAILLCLAGGWPASAECAHARAVFIARITPWPVEPPLQIWNCPMHAEFRRETPIERLFDIAFQPSSPPQLSLPTLPFPAAIPVVDQADIDISDPAYDFARSIRVYQTEYRRHRSSDGDCNVWSTVRLGTYGEQGDYAWHRSSVDKLPPASGFSPSSGCNDYYFRSVFVDWKDYEGTYGFEEVRY